MRFGFHLFMVDPGEHLEIARTAELSKSTCHRYVTSLVSLGYLEQDAETRHAQLKPRPPAQMRIDPHREPPRLSPPGPDLSPGW